MTYDAVVVDDEKLAIDGMRRFGWESHGFQLVATFQDPTRALEWLKVNSTHLIMADIRMPQMSGLELTKTIHDLFPDIVVILFSGHSEFSYAQKAIRYGVVRYVLKPVDDDELATALADVSSLLDDRERRKHWTRRIMRDRWVREQISEYSLPVDNQSAAPQWLQTTGFVTYRVGLLPAGVELRARQLEHVDGILHTIVLSDGHVACVIDGARLSCVVQARLSDGFRIGLSAEHKTFDEIRTAFQEARKTLEALFAHPDRTCLHFEHVVELSPSARRNLYVRAGVLSERMAHYEFENGIDEIHSFFEKIRESKAPEHIAKQLTFTVALGVQRLTSRWVGNDTEENLEAIPDPFEVVEYSTNILNLETHFVEAVSNILQRVEMARATREQDSRLDGVLKYIDAHYHELISLDDVAEYAQMHPSRLSVWFKSSMGEAYIEYLTRLRISVAKELLSRSGDVYIRDVALKVGYPDARYFSQVFKRVVGTTPRAYQRAQISMKNEER